jgi:hypothetical protein
MNLLWHQKTDQYGVRGQCSSHIISDAERCETMSSVWFDAELNGLQNDVNVFLAIDFWPRHLVKILKKHEIPCAKNLRFFSL